MEASKICIYCMSGTVTGGVCTHCGKNDASGAPRPVQTLPARYMLCKGQYVLGRILGSGGFGITYLAWDQKFNRRVAVKEFFPRHLAARDEKGICVRVHHEQRPEFDHAKMRFQEEAQALYELRGIPEIIDVFHLFEENGTAYYVMEFLSGQDMKGYLAARGVMTWNMLQLPVSMILRALDAVHKRQMIHRDISPDNIFMLQEGGAKLIDFGNARSFMSANPLTKIIKTRFAPVEQFSDDKGRQGPWTDIYSLSVTLYYALSGILPPPASERLIGVKTQGQDPVRPLESLNPSIPPHVLQGVRKGMEVMEMQRYHTVAEFAAQLFPGTDILERGGAQSGMGQPPIGAQPGMGQPQSVGMQSSVRQPPIGMQPGAGQQQPVGMQPGAGQPQQPQASASTGRMPGLRQYPPRHPAQTPAALLQCVQGLFRGRRFTLMPGRTETLGRGKDVSVVYPAESQGISRHQCSFMMDNKGIIYVRDDQSSYGTRLNGQPMQPGRWYPLKQGDRVCFAKEEYRIM